MAALSWPTLEFLKEILIVILSSFTMSCSRPDGSSCGSRAEGVKLLTRGTWTIVKIQCRRNGRARTDADVVLTLIRVILTWARGTRTRVETEVAVCS